MSDEGKRWTITNHAEGCVSQVDCDCSGEKIEVVPASELDRLEAEEKNLRADLATEEQNARAALSRAEAAEARVRELTEALEWIREQTVGFDEIGPKHITALVNRVDAALNAPAEDEDEIASVAYLSVNDYIALKEQQLTEARAEIVAIEQKLGVDRDRADRAESEIARLRGALDKQEDVLRQLWSLADEHSIVRDIIESDLPDLHAKCLDTQAREGT